MTAQDAFLSWLIYPAAIAAGLFALFLGIAIVVVAISSQRRRDEER